MFLLQSSTGQVHQFVCRLPTEHHQISSTVSNLFTLINSTVTMLNDIKYGTLFEHNEIITSF